MAKNNPIKQPINALSVNDGETFLYETIALSKT
jgi:hypothetical protein